MAQLQLFKQINLHEKNDRIQLITMQTAFCHKLIGTVGKNGLNEFSP